MTAIRPITRDGIGTSTSNERALWQAVVEMAILDATHPCDGRGRTLLDQEADKIDAEDWFRANSDDFKRVCCFAGYDSDFIRDAVLSRRINRSALEPVRRKAAAQ